MYLLYKEMLNGFQDNLVIIIAKERFNIYLFTLAVAIYSGSPDIIAKTVVNVHAP